MATWFGYAHHKRRRQPSLGFKRNFEFGGRFFIANFYFIINMGNETDSKFESEGQLFFNPKNKRRIWIFSAPQVTDGSSKEGSLSNTSIDRIPDMWPVDGVKESIKEEEKL